MRLPLRLLPLVLLSLLLGCEQPLPAPQTTSLFPTNSAGLPPPPLETDGGAVGAVVYVPVWSSIYIAEGNQTFELTVTLSVRNSDRSQPITITGLRYYDKGGKELHAYVEKPTQIGPLASADTVVKKSDTRAGVGGSFVVEWQAAEVVTEPVIQAIMVGTDYQQGISFLTEGRVLERTHPIPPSPAPPQPTGPPG